MDLHVYRKSQDRWHGLRSAARERGAVLALNAVTLEELVERLTPEAKTASPGQRLILVERAIEEIGDGTRAKARDYIGGQHIGDRVLSGNALSGTALSGNESSGNMLSGNESSGSMLSGNESSGSMLSGNELFPNVVAGFSPRSIPNLLRYEIDSVAEL